MLDTSQCEDVLAQCRALADNLGPEARSRFEEKLSTLGTVGARLGRNTVVELYPGDNPLSFVYRLMLVDQNNVRSFGYIGALEWEGVEGWVIRP